MRIRRANGTRAIIFDFDYTLADSSKGIVKCCNSALRDMDLPEASAENICRTIGFSLPEVFVKLAGQEHVHRSLQFVEHFKRNADEVMSELTFVYPIVSPVVLSLREKGQKLGIVSTKFRYRIEDILRRHNLQDLFDIIIGGEDVVTHKPDPEGLNQALTILDCSPAEALYVGDSVVDAETANRAHVSFVAVLSGPTRRSAFRDYIVSEFIDDLQQLTQISTLQHRAR
ncbi:MAG TPA: HAD-IA family hydrolase [Syntrophorhabdaceae bacterium]|nr:HAD-IA family hydrolase [Syntrophorhabdaceae bacterium]